MKKFSKSTILIILSLVIAASSFIWAAILSQRAPVYYGAGYGPTGRATTLTIAAPNSTALEKSQADYVALTNSSAAWVTAIAALPTNGGSIQAYSGTFTFTQSVTSTKPITISGVGYNTYFSYNASSPIFITGTNNCIFTNLRTDAGGINIGATTGWEKINVIEGSTWYGFANAKVTAGSTLTLTSPTITGGTSTASAAADTITSGTMGTARLGSGSASSTTYLKGNSTWATLPDMPTMPKILSFTRDMTAASGNSTYTGFGFTPSSLLILAVSSSAGSGSVGSANANMAMTVNTNSTTASLNYTDKCIYLFYVSITDRQTALLASYNADGFTLTWTKVGSPTGTANFTVFAFK